MLVDWIIIIVINALVMAFLAWVSVSLAIKHVGAGLVKWQEFVHGEIKRIREDVNTLYTNIDMLSHGAKEFMATHDQAHDNIIKLLSAKRDG